MLPRNKCFFKDAPAVWLLSPRSFIARIRPTEKFTSALIILQTLRALMHPWRNNHYLYKDTTCRILTYVTSIRKSSRFPKGILVCSKVWSFSNLILVIARRKTLILRIRVPDERCIYEEITEVIFSYSYDVKERINLNNNNVGIELSQAKSERAGIFLSPL